MFPSRALRDNGLGFRFSAGLGHLLPDVSFLERFGVAASLGFTGVEYPAPYAYKADVLREQLDAHGLQQVLFNVPVGSRSGDLGLACDPQRRMEFQDSIGIALEYASTLQCAQINCLSGYSPPGVPYEELNDTYVSNLKYAGRQARERSVRIVIEPLNPFDYPNFFLSRTEQATRILAEVDLPNVGLEYDIYHAQMTQGRLGPTLREHRAIIWHIQFADAPTRATPGTGEIRFDYILDELELLDYSGWIGCDYRPMGPKGSFDWLAQWLTARGAAQKTD